MFTHTTGVGLSRLCKFSIDLNNLYSFQARPEDYPADLLAHQVPISFHKHWNIDPIAVFNKWLRDNSSEKSSHELDRTTKTEL